MSEEELEKTKPISTLKDLSLTEELAEEVVAPSRTQKNADIVEKEINKEQEEEAEEALAEKNIALAESLLEEENKQKEEVVVEENEKKPGVFTKLKDKWNNLSKKQKALIILLILAIIILIVIIILILALKHKKPEPEPVEEPTVSITEEAPVIADNFYYKDGKLFFLDEEDKEIGSYECENKSADLCYVGFNNNSDKFDVTLLLDSSGNSIEQRYPILDNNYAFVIDNKEESNKSVKLYSVKDKKVLEEYSDVKTFDDNYVIVAKNNKYGLVRVESGITPLIEPQYNYLGMVSGQSSLVAQDSKGYKIVDKTNKVLSSNFSSKYEIKGYNDNFVIAKISGDYALYNYEADLIDTDYEYIMVNGDYAFLAKNNKLYIRDKDKLKYNEGTIRLKNNNYVKTFVYDDNNNLLSAKLSFDVSIKSTKDIDVSVYTDADTEPEVTTVKAVEALVNKKYDYVNYFEKTLYFYSDEEKEVLLGSYDCTNANEVTQPEDEYNTCFIAKDSIYEDNDMVSEEDVLRKSRIPIINNHFAFIEDGANNIVLYDFVKKAKPEASYTSVNSYTSNNDFKITHRKGKISVIALGKKGKYGMITIDGDSVTVAQVFNYNKMEMIGNYILVLDTNNKWKIIYGSNNESVEFDNKIRGYNSTGTYFKTANNGNYSVYDVTGGLVSNETYNYVELYSNYYAGINSERELYLYNYDGTKICNEGISIANYPYYKTSKPAFKVTKNSDGYTVFVYNGTDYDEVTIVNGEVVKEPAPEPEE